MIRQKPFSTDLTDNKSRNYIILTLLWYLVDIIFFIFLGLVESSIINIITGLFLICWLIFTILLFNHFTLKNSNIVFYALGVAVLGIIEETPIYYNGGGLNGTATSLVQDLFLTIPVFVLLGISIYLLKDKFALTSSDFFIYGSIYGVILELFIGGKLVYFYLFGGPALVIYGSMLATFAPKELINKKQNVNSYLKFIIIIIVMFIFMIAGAIIGDTSYRFIGKP